MPVVTFATFIVIADFPQSRTAIEERILKAVSGWGYWLMDSPEHHLHDCSIEVFDALVKEQFSIHITLMMAL
jgi:hypothetical protein